MSVLLYFVESLFNIKHETASYILIAILTGIAIAKLIELTIMYDLFGQLCEEIKDDEELPIKLSKNDFHYDIKCLSVVIVFAIILFI